MKSVPDLEIPSAAVKIFREYAHSYFVEILMGFCSDRSYECVYKIWSS